MSERAKEVSQMEDELQSHQRQPGNVTEMPWLLISNQIQQMNSSINERFNAMEKSINERFNAMEKSINERFDAVNRRIDDLKEDMDRRFEAVDRRFEAVEKRIDSLENKMLQKPGFLWGILGSVILLLLGALLNQHIHIF
ncbi:hypothetical protein ACOJUR_15515 [Alicyclobacillus tolerans]|uniref:hypothetical protein n=1 Tax=Alicyclobacillus tolerans TaxID=90970 RepID=UPI003B7DA1EF